MKRMLLLGTVLPMAVSVATPALAESPFDGSWKIDMGATKLPDKPDAYVLKDGVYECSTCAPGYKVKADGAFHPAPGHAYYDQVAIKVVDPHTIALSGRKGAKTVFTETSTVSADGQTLTSAFKDMTAANGSVVTGKGTQTRVGKGPAGSHAISGSWRTTSYSGLSENGLLISFKTEGNKISMSTPTGQSYTATFGGPAVPIKGDTGGTFAQVKKVDARTFEETDTQKGKVSSIATVSVSPDGKIMTAVIDDKLHGTKTEYKAMKQ